MPSYTFFTFYYKVNECIDKIVFNQNANLKHYNIIYLNLYNLLHFYLVFCF